MDIKQAKMLQEIRSTQTIRTKNTVMFAAYAICIPQYAPILDKSIFQKATSK